jgi:thiaminase/transcriptional activator TenA
MKEFESSRLAVASGELWKAGTTARFLDAVGDGSLPEEAFARWLAQDHLFVDGFTRFVALTAAKTQRPDQSTIIAGLAALDAELEWFQSCARDLALDLDVEAHPICRRYVDFLIASAYSKPMEVLLAILFGVEVAYTVGWGRFEAEGRYAEFIDRWTNAEFQRYVVELMRLADAHPHPDQQEAFNEVLRHERDFWRMTWEG